MMPSEIYEIDGNKNFITKRFDRDGERKLHTQTLAAISPETESYEGLIAVCRKLHLPESDCQEVFRRLVFNILSNNTDDHTKTSPSLWMKREHGDCLRHTTSHI